MGDSNKKCQVKRVIATQSVTFEELHTIVVQVETNLNSRPLTPIPTYSNVLNVITPRYFLIGDMLTAPPDPNLTDVKFGRL